MIDQIRAVTKYRLKAKIEAITPKDLDSVIGALSTILEIR